MRVKNRDLSSRLSLKTTVDCRLWTPQVNTTSQRCKHIMSSNSHNKKQSTIREHDSCYDHSTDDEADKPLGDFEECDLNHPSEHHDESDQCNLKETDDAEDCAKIPAAALDFGDDCIYADCFSDEKSDEDSVDLVLQFDERYLDADASIAFCCQNCK